MPATTSDYHAALLNDNGTLFTCSSDASCNSGGWEFSNRKCLSNLPGFDVPVCVCNFHAAHSGPGYCSWRNNIHGVALVVLAFSAISVSTFLVARYIRAVRKRQRALPRVKSWLVMFAVAQFVGQIFFACSYLIYILVEFRVSWDVQATAELAGACSLLPMTFGVYGVLVLTAYELAEVLWRSNHSGEIEAWTWRKKLRWAFVAMMPMLSLVMTTVLFSNEDVGPLLVAVVSLFWGICSGIFFMRSSRLLLKRLKAFEPAKSARSVNGPMDEGDTGVTKITAKIATMASRIAEVIVLGVASAAVNGALSGNQTPYYMYGALGVVVCVTVLTAEVIERMLPGLSPLSCPCFIVCRKRKSQVAPSRCKVGDSVDGKESSVGTLDS